MRKLMVSGLILIVGFSCSTKEKSPPSGQLDSALVVRYYGADGKTALELLEEKHPIEKKTSSAGSFVEAIDGVKNREGRFWLYYVNGKKPEVASDRYFTTAQDTIEWRFEKYSEEEK
ncbi:MAG: DUF4430 domain-containing protein [candidate division Zixibacteria bacterium]|nr:DUF4430 domain-containing protein [candidate division Zixibacteria bacterium]MCI0595231.1 DUF4430 domain-containing protein [candidate division Zixibacteria bacterium]